MDDPRIEKLIRARYEMHYEAYRKEPCPYWVGPSARFRAQCEDELEAWLPVLERMGFIEPLASADRPA